MIAPKIVNSYHKQSFSGIGDFFRGSIYLYNRCRDLGISFSFSLCDHPISKHLKLRSEDTCDSDSIFDIPINFSNSDKSLGLSKFSALELDKTFDFLKGMRGGKKFIFSNYHEIMNTPAVNVMNHINSIELDEDLCNWFKKNIYFSDAIEDAVDSSLNFKDFNIVHFRIGDTNSFCKDKTDFLIDEDYFLSIINRQEKKNTVIISDNNKLKSFFIKNQDKISFPILIPHFKSSHTQKNTGIESLEVGENSEFYTAFDLKLLTMASKVTGYSSYYWGTGFSCWVSKLFSVPFSCKPFMKEGKVFNLN
jgi:hypothetical protein